MTLMGADGADDDTAWTGQQGATHPAGALQGFLKLIGFVGYGNPTYSVS
jgi:hypothetical protein